MQNLTLTQAVGALKRQQLVVLPTDTIYGISAVVSKQSLQKIQKLKCRKKSQSCIILVDKLQRIEHLIDSVNQYDERLIANKKQVTWLLPAHNAPSWLKVNNKIAVRISNNYIVQQVCNLLSGGVFSTSVNLQGEPPLTNLASIYASPLADNFAGIVKDGKLCGQQKNKASKIMDLQTKFILRA